ncbi:MULTISPECIES: MerR family transcriptional regulator [Vibrio]|uniref:MerR family transcriptional regulator n=1 Tax=Vibrio TaxID=662 RepID=UPI001120D77E|nr:MULTISPECIES: MerR family transcriptional regulator [Vibrio]EGQ9249960.1 MerR family transcriptional regulator [Vibrio parahaemolyticus]EJG1183548.1 MerR family transcriptional regulator [Vibrio parahaemolyticus]EJG1192832.1 MerR family transcriptional regulator [Vibrio parahaemolyticus]EJO9870384.1 MerR family transcriptional regulator [Vibrio vulnificus]EJU9841352.1 MerR family transcriptional regulator [Vibrio parahaemolyticus]
MLTVTQIAKQFGVSRTTILYYEKEELLIPAYRSENGYRWYGEKEIERLEAITSYRSYGLSVSSIRTLLDRNGESQAKILKDHFNELEREIQNLRAQQKAVVVLLQEPSLLEENIVNKERWVEIMVAAGFTETDMVKWHQKFEELEPNEHQKFLESLGISGDEITKIRAL